MLCRKISQINPYCETSNKLTNQVIDLRFEFEEIYKNILEFIAWQEFDEGREVHLINIEESHKDILFRFRYTVKAGRKGNDNSIRYNKQHN